ncbi:MAG: calcium-binding protein, partial [Gammaproteobacteria bacterium]|nr:calcium-binding protein [Gammaproteobacteria bacterium]
MDRIQFDGPFRLNVAFNAGGTLRTQADVAAEVAVLGDEDGSFTGLFDKRDLKNGTDEGPTLLGALDLLATDVNVDGDDSTWDVTGLLLTEDYNQDGLADYGAGNAPVYFADTSGKGMFTMSVDPDLHALDYTVAQILGDTISFDALTADDANWIEADWGGRESYDDPDNAMVQRMVFRESADSGTYNQNTGEWEYTSGSYRYELSGMGRDDVLRGGDNNDRFYSDPGDDLYDGRTDKKGDWWDAWNNGDVVQYDGYQARYTISGPLTDDDAGTVTGIIGGQAYFTVTDSLAMEYGGDGTDTLVNIERIQFGDQDYFLQIRDMTNDWDSNSRLIGTSGDDDFLSYTSEDKDYFINPGAGDDLVVGKQEGGDNSNTWGDAVVYDGSASYFDIAVAQVAFADLAPHMEEALRARFSDSDNTNDVTETIMQVTVTDRRDDDSGGMGVDTLYGIERIEFQSNGNFTAYDILPTQQDWDGDGLVDEFRGTGFGDHFVGDAGDTWIHAGGGDDVIIAGDGADAIDAGSGNDFVHGGASGTVDEWGWGGRDEVMFHDAPYARVEVEGIKVVLDDNDTPVTNADGQWIIYEYAGDQALNSKVVSISSDAAPVTAVAGFLVTDTLPGNETGSIGTNIVVDVEAMGFSDQFLDLEPMSSSSSWTDWYTGETFVESYERGTPFADTITGANGSDTLEGEAGNDYLQGMGGGDRMRGGTGHDLIDGGADGSSGDPWRDMDVAEYSGIEARYTVYTVKVEVDDATGKPTVTDGKYQIYDTGSEMTANDLAALSNFSISQSAVPGTSDTSLATAFVVSDALTSALGGHGNDLLLNVEQAQFSDGQMDLGFRVNRFDWDGDDTYDMVEVMGTDSGDNMTASAWGDGTDEDSDGESDDVALDNELRGKGGNDHIEGGSGGDRITGGAGNDFIDGGANGTADNWGYVSKDEAIYEGSSRNYTVTTYTYDASEGADNAALETAVTNTGATVTLQNGQSYTVIADSLPDAMGGAGTDVITNVEFLAFQDAFVPLAMEEWIDYRTVDGQQVEVRRFVNGTSGDDTVTGGDGNDDLQGNEGNDTINGGAGGDYIVGGLGDDVIDGGADGIDEWNGQIIGDR